MTFLDPLNSPKCDFTQNQSGGKIIKFQQSQALTSHFEIFWSIVPILDPFWPIFAHFDLFLLFYNFRFARALAGMVMFSPETSEIAKPSELLTSVSIFTKFLIKSDF